VTVKTDLLMEETGEPTNLHAAGQTYSPCVVSGTLNHKVHSNPQPVLEKTGVSSENHQL
jgi:hypothetical protein